MSTNYLKFVVRIFLKERFYTLLNIIGLATGIAVSIIILLYLQNDLTYDRYHVNYRQIYRMVTNVRGPGVEFHVAETAREVPPLLVDDYPEILSYVRLQRIGTTLIQVPGQTEALYNEKDILKADSTVFDVFTHPFIAGNPQTALTGLHSIVLTEKLATKYFGNVNEALGQTLLIGDGKENYKVTGVIEDLPDNSHLKFNGLLSHIDERGFAVRDGQFNSEVIWNPDVYTYLLFPEGYNTADFFDKFQPFYDKYIKPFGDIVDSELWYRLEPLQDIHFQSTQESDEPQGNVAYIYAFGAIGIFILLLACINYMNMATARSGTRTKEIGVRKVLGSSKKSLVFSFLGEALMMAFFALAVSLCLVAIILYLTPFNSLIEKQLTLNFAHNPLLLWGTLGITLFIGLVSGLYPAFYLPNIGVVQSMKGSFNPKISGISFRKMLVVFQFIVSIAVVICTLLMKDQIDYVRNKELGFNKDHLMLVNIPDTLVQKQIPVIKNEMSRYSGIAGVTVAYNAPGIGVGTSVFKVETDSVMTQQAFNGLYVGEHYLKTMGIKLLAGRDFNEGFEGDARGNSFLINETAAKSLGWYNAADEKSTLEDALGKEIMFFHGETPGHVVGIIEDINVNSLHNPIQPTIIVPTEEEGGMFYFRLKGENLPQTMDFIRDKWATYDPNHPFEYRFLDEEFDAMYRADERQSNLITILAGICLLVSFLGVLGLSAFTAQRRTKEIGVRKVMGASIPQIVYLLYKEVMYLVIIAALLAAPLAYYVTSKWLENFAFRTNMNVLLFLVAALAALVLTFLIMSFHSIRTARLNPVVSLRYE